MSLTMAMAFSERWSGGLYLAAGDESRKSYSRLPAACGAV